MSLDSTSVAQTSAANGLQGFYWGELADYETYARYLARVIDLYHDIGIDFWGLSIQNEPYNEPNSWPVMRMSAQNQTHLVSLLGPLLQDKSFAVPRLMVYEHNWENAQYPIDVLSNPISYPYIAGTAWHCYGGDVMNQSVVHDLFPSKEIYFTECSGWGAIDWEGDLEWDTDQIWLGATNHWATMVIHWNLVLDQFDGPHQGGCPNCRGIFMMENDTHSDPTNFTYFEEYYGIAHFGKFISVNGAKRVRVDMIEGCGCVNGTAFVNNDQSRTLIVIMKNFCTEPQLVAVQRMNGNGFIEVTLPRGLSTFYFGTSTSTTMIPTISNNTTDNPTTVTTGLETTQTTIVDSATGIHGMCTLMIVSIQTLRLL
eukprot:368271_1